MREILLSLIALQKVDSELMEIEELKGDLPSEVARLDTELESLRAGIASSQENIKLLDKDKHKFEAGAADKQVTLKKYQEQLLLVSTNRSYDALMAEIDTARQSSESDGMQALEIEEKITGMAEQVKSDEISLQEKTELFAIRQKSLQQTIAETEVEAGSLARQRLKLQKKVDEDMYQTYERLRSAHDGEAVVAISRDACGSCFSAIPAQLASDLKAMDKIIACQTCGVIMYRTPD